MPIAIVGTGRSGTSMVARMLNLCGIYIGEADEIAAQDEWNPKGFWEHAGIYDLNERLFAIVGGSFVEPPTLPQGWELDPRLDDLFDEARALIDRSFGDYAEWAWKLPQATVTLPFWRRVVPGLKLIVCVRNPLDYASSIGKYYQLTQQQALSIWQFYNFHVLSATLPQERTVTFYEDYFPNYHCGLDPLLEWLKIERPAPGDAVDRAIAEFHDPSLKHHSTPLDQLVARPDVPYLTKELYLQLLADQASSEGVPLLKQAEAYLPLLHQAITPTSVTHSVTARLKQQIDELQLERRVLVADNEHMAQILASRTHQLADQICNMLIRFPFGNFLHLRTKAASGWGSMSNHNSNS